MSFQVDSRPSPPLAHFRSKATESVVRGIDRFFEFQGHTYIISCEDLGPEDAELEVRVLEDGAVLWSRTIHCDTPMGRDRWRSVRRLMERSQQAVQAAISRGLLGDAAGVAQLRSAG